MQGRRPRSRFQALAPAPRPDRPLLEDLADGVRKPRFLMALMRQGAMLWGVFALGWPPLEIAVFFLVEAFLFLSLRAAAEISIDDRFGVGARSAPAVVGQIATHWLVAAPFIALLVGGFGAIAVIPAFPRQVWKAFLGEGMREPSFLVAIGLLAGSLIYDTALFARRVAAGRSTTEQAGDDEGIRLALAKVVLLGMASFWLGLAARLGLGPQALAVGIAGVLLAVEAVPHRVTRLLTPRVVTDGQDGRAC